MSGVPGVEAECFVGSSLLELVAVFAFFFFVMVSLCLVALSIYQIVLVLVRDEQLFFVNSFSRGIPEASPQIAVRVQGASKRAYLR